MTTQAKKKELKKQMQEQYQKEQQAKQMEEAENQKSEKERKKKELEEGIKQWDAHREERLKKFFENRDDPAKETSADPVRRRAKTLGTSAPVSHFFQPPQPKIVQRPRMKTTVPELTERPVPSVPMPLRDRLQYDELFDASGKPNTKLLKEFFYKEGKLSKDCALAILEKVEPILRKEPNLLELEAPITVVGDVHGQYHDIIHLLESAGDPADTQYLFLGDYVDRGSFGTEVCFLLFAYKINHPFTFFLLRGNHESRLLTSHFNFKLECYHKYDGSIYDLLMNIFDCLPIAALVTNNQGSFLCTHGGLSPDIIQLDDIEDIDRFQEPPERGPLCDLLWSDPIEESTALGLTEDDMEEWFDVDYVPNPTRGCGFVFGYAAVAPFLENNNLVCLIRAHEVQKDGYHCHYFWKRDLEFPLTITVFSAPNYCDIYGNQAGYIKFEENDFDFHQVSWVEHPFYLPNFMNGITYSLPYALEAFTKLCAYILEGCMMALEDGEPNETDEDIRRKVNSFGKMSVLIQKIRERREEIVSGSVNLGDEVSKFEKALQLDCRNEKRPNTEIRRRRTRTVA